MAAVTRRSLALTGACNREAMKGLVQLVTSLFEQRRFKAGDVLARQGTPATTMFYLQEGTCEIVHDLYEGDLDEDFVEEAVSACAVFSGEICVVVFWVGSACACFCQNLLGVLLGWELPTWTEGKIPCKAGGK